MFLWDFDRFQLLRPPIGNQLYYRCLYYLCQTPLHCCLQVYLIVSSEFPRIIESHERLELNPAIDWKARLFCICLFLSLTYQPVVHVRHFKQLKCSLDGAAGNWWKEASVWGWMDGWMGDRQMDKWWEDKWMGRWIAGWVHRWMRWWTDYLKDGGEGEEQWNGLGGFSSDELMNKWTHR